MFMSFGWAVYLLACTFVCGAFCGLATGLVAHDKWME